MTLYANIHYYLNELRHNAQSKNELGPRVLITGLRQSGKLEAVKILINYACKTGWMPIFCDLSFKSNEILNAGVIGACVCQYHYPEDFLLFKNKILYNLGFRNQSEFRKNIYLQSIKALGHAINKKLSQELQNFKQTYKIPDDCKQTYKDLFVPEVKSVFSSGFIAKAPYFEHFELRKETVLEIIHSMMIDIVIVIEDDEMSTFLAKNFHPKKIILKTTRPPGVQPDNIEQEHIVKR